MHLSARFHIHNATAPETAAGHGCLRGFFFRLSGQALPAPLKSLLSSRRFPVAFPSFSRCRFAVFPPFLRRFPALSCRLSAVFPQCFKKVKNNPIA